MSSTAAVNAGLTVRVVVSLDEISRYSPELVPAITQTTYPIYALSVYEAAAFTNVVVEPDSAVLVDSTFPNLVW